MSRIDRFLLSKEWDEHFCGVIQVALQRIISDHSPIKLSSVTADWGPRPFRFENFWLEHKDFLGLAHSWWNQVEVSGYAGYRMYKKLHFLKENIKKVEKGGFWPYR